VVKKAENFMLIPNAMKKIIIDAWQKKRTRMNDIRTADE